MLLKSGGGSKTRLLQTASQFHDRMAEEEVGQNYLAQLDGRRFSSYCKKIYLPTLFLQMSLVTTCHHLKRICTHVLVTHKTQDIPFLFPRGFQATSTMSQPANQMGVTQDPNETRRVANVVQVINTNRIWHFLFHHFLCFSPPMSSL